ncbi:uncharacterized protein [Fopius arisanus]|uniref:Uncharacterized protein isoform X1 n=1 Tax=Fopius arisanus TaxID=64838 RepID=A0A9R1U8X6_9HYME|nr:PREDICTED: uncharacterized protein LOC105272834 isoform X1 [Fopius arisanus]
MEIETLPREDQDSDDSYLSETENVMRKYRSLQQKQEQQRLKNRKIPNGEGLEENEKEVPATRKKNPRKLIISEEVRSRAESMRELNNVIRERDLLKEDNAALKIKVHKLEEDIEKAELRMDLSVSVVKKTVQEAVRTHSERHKLITIDKQTKLVHLPHEKTMALLKYQQILHQKTFRKRVNKLIEWYWPERTQRDNFYFEIKEKTAHEHPEAELVPSDDLIILKDILEALQEAHWLVALDAAGNEVPWELAYKGNIQTKLNSDRDVHKKAKEKKRSTRRAK